MEESEEASHGLYGKGQEFSHKEPKLDTIALHCSR